MNDDEPDAPPEFPNRIFKYRKAARLSLTELAHRAGLSFQTLQRWEKKHPKLELKRVERLAKELGVTPNQLLPYQAEKLAPDEQFIIDRMRAATAQERRQIVKSVKALTDRDEEPLETRKPRD